MRSDLRISTIMVALFLQSAAWGAGITPLPSLHAVQPLALLTQNTSAHAEHVGPEWTPFRVLSVDPSQIPAIERMLGSSDAELRSQSAFLLGQVGSVGSIPLLVAHTTDTDARVCMQCGIALASMGDPRGIPGCKSALSSDQDWIRYYAAYGLWCINTPESRSVLAGAPAKQTAFMQGILKSASSTRTSNLPPPAVVKRSSDPSHSSADICWDAANKFLMESNLWYHAGNYDQTIRCMDAAVLFTPSNVDLYATSAWLLWSMGRSSEAEAELHRGIDANPKDPQAYFELGEQLYNTNKFAQAEPILEKAVKLGGSMLARHLYAHCLESEGKLQAALEEWKIIDKANPKDPAAKHNMARVQAQIKAGHH